MVCERDGPTRVNESAIARRDARSYGTRPRARATDHLIDRDVARAVEVVQLVDHVDLLADRELGEHRHRADDLESVDELVLIRIEDVAEYRVGHLLVDAEEHRHLTRPERELAPEVMEVARAHRFEIVLAPRREAPQPLIDRGFANERRVAPAHMEKEGFGLVEAQRSVSCSWLLIHREQTRIQRNCASIYALCHGAQ